jgi:hypothetical protein
MSIAIKSIDEVKNLYAKFYSSLPQSYNKKICPFFAQTGEKYYETDKKCLFIGKSVNSWITDSRNVNELFNLTNPNRIINRDDEIKFIVNLEGNKLGYNSKRSSFWRVIKNITKNIFSKDDWFNYIAWSNLYKFSFYSGGNPDAYLKNIQTELCKEILDKEIDLIKPKYIIFLTSGWEKFYLDHIHLGKNENKYITWDGNKIFFQKKNGIMYIQSQHPQGKKEPNHIKSIEKIIMEEI